MKRLFKYIYSILPFKKQAFEFIKLLYTPNEKIYRHLYFKGTFKVKVDGGHFRIKHYGYQLENEIFWKGLEGGWENQSITVWSKLCKSSKVIVDIGANTGVFSLIAKAINPASQVYAFEPVKRVFEKLVKNNQLNNYDIQCFEEAISNKTGKAVIFDTPTEHIYSVTVNQNLHIAGTSTIETQIRTITLDEFCDQQNINKIDLLKIDVETHEPEVLEGYKNLFAAHLPSILIEVLNDDVANAIQGCIVGLPYLYFNIDEDNSIRKVDKITKSDYYNFLLCTKETAIYLNLIRDEK